MSIGIEVGDRVRILESDPDDQAIQEGAEGTVKEVYGENAGILFFVEIDEDLDLAGLPMETTFLPYEIEKVAK